MDDDNPYSRFYTENLIRALKGTRAELKDMIRDELRGGIEESTRASRDRVTRMHSMVQSISVDLQP